MKNTKLSSIHVKPLTYYIKNNVECFKFSRLGDIFFLVIQDAEEYAEVKFHMSREWSDMFYDFYMKTE